MLPSELDASVDAWRVTVDVVVKTDGTPVRMLSCTVDTQWHGTTVRTLPLHGSLWAGLSLTDGEMLVRVLRIVTGEEAICCLVGQENSGLWTPRSRHECSVLLPGKACYTTCGVQGA